MRKLWMVGVLAAALFATTARAEDAAKERREAADATSDQMRQEGREAKANAQEAGRDAKAGAQRTGNEAQREMAEQQRETNKDMAERQHDAQQASAKGDKKHPLFEGKNNFDVDGKIQKVSPKSITVAREGLPAATLNISKDTKIELDGEQASMKQLKQGQDVKASFNLKGDKPEAVEVKAEKMK
jgi:Cu/Ag efflux protein CusF